MENLILFVNAFFSYLLCFVVIVVLCAIAIYIGIKLRKNKDAKMAAMAEVEETDSLPAQETEAEE